MLDTRKHQISFMLLYALIFMGVAIYNIFIPVYLDSLGYNRAAIGVLTALGPFIAILAQPIWGTAGDRAKSKNSILKILVFGSAAAIMLYRASNSFYYLLIIISVFMFFQTAINSLSDTVTLEYLDSVGKKFGPVRMAGTLGYAIMAVTAGALASRDINVVFVLYFIISILLLAVVFSLPVIRGHQSENNKITFWSVFKNRKLVVLMLFSLIVQITLGYNSTFFPVFYRHLGADNTLLGWAMLLSSGSEVPFLFFADKITKKIGIQYTFIGSAAAAVIRWFLLSRVSSPLAVLPIQLLHGLILIVFTFSMATYINENVPRELKASGQAANALVSAGIARIIGNVLGGILSDAYGLQKVFLYNSLLTFAAVIIFGGIFIYNGKKPQMESLN